MKKYLLAFLIICCFGGIVYAQAVANNLQQQIQDAQNGIASDYADIHAKKAFINSIENDNSAVDVTESVPAIANQVEAIQAAQTAMPVGVSPAQPAPAQDTQGTQGAM